MLIEHVGLGGPGWHAEAGLNWQARWIGLQALRGRDGPALAMQMALFLVSAPEFRQHCLFRASQIGQTAGSKLFEIATGRPQRPCRRTSVCFRMVCVRAARGDAWSAPSSNWPARNHRALRGFHGRLLCRPSTLVQQDSTPLRRRPEASPRAGLLPQSHFTQSRCNFRSSRSIPNPDTEGARTRSPRRVHGRRRNCSLNSRAFVSEVVHRKSSTRQLSSLTPAETVPSVV